MRTNIWLALSTTRELVNEVNRDSRTLERFIVDGARAMTNEPSSALVATGQLSMKTTALSTGVLPETTLPFTATPVLLKVKMGTYR